MNQRSRIDSFVTRPLIACLCCGLLGLSVQEATSSAQATLKSPPDDSAPANAHRTGLAWRLDLPPNRLAGGGTSDPERGVAFVLAPANKAGEFKRCLQITADGKIEHEFNIEGGNIILDAARLRPGAGRDLLSYTQWTSALRAINPEGNTVWKYPVEQGINDVWPADLDGDGLDEIIIGFNGSTGVHVLDHDGNKSWETQHIGNVWKVGAVDFDGDGASHVTTYSKGDAIAVFKRDGTRLADVAMPAGYTPLLRPVRLSESNRAEGVLLQHKTDTRFAALKSDGKLAWEIALGERVAVNALELAPGKTWLALYGVGASLRGSIWVIDTTTGAIIAQMQDRDKGSNMCWLQPKDGSAPLLLRLTDSGINAFRIES